MKDVYDLYPNVEALRRRESFPDIKEPFFWDVFHRAKPYSLLGVEAFYGLYTAMSYVARAGIRGDFVECGVFLGGSVLAASEFAAHFGIRDRRFHLYDTFEGFPDNIAPETDYTQAEVRFGRFENFLAVTRSVVAKSSYPQHLFNFVVGDVREQLSTQRPSEIALLRLDTDDYSSTRSELEQLYPQLVSRGVVIVDDYGCFEGARRATDEFFAEREPPYLQRISLGPWAGTKP